MPGLMNRRLFKAFHKLGEAFGKTGEFDKKMVANLAKPEKLSKLKFWIVSTLGPKMYWDPLLKNNNAYEKRFDRPYAVESKAN
jgi:hypothetical protein